MLLTEIEIEITPDLIRRLDLSPVVRQFGTWAVTDYGVESLTWYYPIEKSRLGEIDWEKHMAEKTWVEFGDFVAALEFARKRFYSLVGQVRPSLRFAVLKRDGYRCKLCGRSAEQDGVRLEVDHKHPKSKGGKSVARNLWTLCYDCNRGKSDSLLTGEEP